MSPHGSRVRPEWRARLAAPLFRVTALFAERAGRTELRMRMALPTADKAAKTRAFIKAVGGDATWDRLGEVLAERLHRKE